MFGKKSEKVPDLEMFTIFDSKSKSYGKPTQAVNRHVLMRDIVNMFRDPNEQKNQLLMNAEDFSIFKIGEYWNETGTLTTHNHEHIANMHDLRALAQPSGIVST